VTRVLVQLEMTMRCNFGCFQRAGRQMRQGNMPYDTFTALPDQHIATYGVPKVVSLQGEGEPPWTTTSSAWPNSYATGEPLLTLSPTHTGSKRWATSM
jgi:hypothetical protein